MMTRLLVAAAAVALLAAGCGGGPSRRDALTRYIDQVNVIDAGLAQPAQTIADASRALAGSHPDYRRVGRELQGAAARIDVLDRHLARVAAPDDAGRLRSLLMKLLSREAGLARELAAYGFFIRGFTTDVQPLGPAGEQLTKSLSGKTTASREAAALDGYAATVGRVTERLQALHAPPVSAPVRATEIRTLRHVRSDAAALARLLRTKQPARIPSLEHAFDVAVAGNETLPAQRARIAAVRAFNANVNSLDSLTEAIDRERTRLQASLA